MHYVYVLRSHAEENLSFYDIKIILFILYMRNVVVLHVYYVLLYEIWKAYHELMKIENICINGFIWIWIWMQTCRYKLKHRLLQSLVSMSKKSVWMSDRRFFCFPAFHIFYWIVFVFFDFRFSYFYICFCLRYYLRAMEYFNSF